MNVQRVSILFKLSKHKILFSRINHLALCYGRILVSHDKKQTHFCSNRQLWLHDSCISVSPTQLTFFVTRITTCHFRNYPGVKRLMYWNHFIYLFLAHPIIQVCIRGGQIQLLMFSVSHFLAEQQTITVSEISNFLIHCTLNVHFNFTIANLKQWVIGVNSALFVSTQKTGFACPSSLT